jgi:putative ABC transport system ATP-binding protein
MTMSLRLDRVSREFGSGDVLVRALDDVSLDVRPGELVVLTGPSGCGKTTLLRVAGGLDHPTHGSVWLNDQSVHDLSPNEQAALRRRQVGFVYQDFNLISSLNAEENVALPLELDGVRVRPSRAAARQQLERVGLRGLERRLPGELSGGQQQRVAIARATIGARTLILADEPTGAVDQTTGRSILALLRAACDGGAAAVVATHDLMAREFADRVVGLRDGRVERCAGQACRR